MENKSEDKTLTLSDAFIEHIKKDFKEMKFLFTTDYKTEYVRSRNENYNNVSKRLSRRKMLGRKYIH